MNATHSTPVSGNRKQMIARVLALVVDYRTTPDAERLTRELAGACHEAFELTVAHVDNGNAVPVLLSSAQRAFQVRLVRVEHNGGYASGIRDAITQLAASGEHFDAYWMLNSDLEIDPACLRKLVEVLNANPQVGAVGPTVMKGKSTRVWGARGVISPVRGTTAMSAWPQGGSLPRWSYIPGCSLLVRRTAYEIVGGIPDRYGMFYEETELCVRLQKKGWDLWVEPSAKVYHDVHSMTKGIPAPYQAFYFARNNLYFWKANFGIPWFVQLPRTLFVVARDLVLPLRRAESLSEALDRLRYIGMGLADGFSFLERRYTHFERKHFHLEPREHVRPET